MRYDLVEIHAPGYPVLKSDGIDVKDDTKTTDVTIGNSHEKIDTSIGDRTITWDFINPKDIPEFFDIYYDCIHNHLKITLICVAYDEKNNTKTVGTLINCIADKYDVKENSKKEFAVTFSGSAEDHKRSTYQFDSGNST